VTVYYLDTSALVKYYVTEPGSVWVRRLVADQDNVLVSTEITIAEVSAALAVITRVGRASRRQRDELWGKFKRDLLTCYELLPTHRAIINRAAELCQQHPLRGFDAMHLASSLYLQETLTQQEEDVIITHVTSDDG
jgi:predicted nucleic acid-binding protein